MVYRTTSELTMFFLILIPNWGRMLNNQTKKQSHCVARITRQYKLCPEDSTNKNNACGHHFAMTTSVEK